MPLPISPVWSLLHLAIKYPGISAIAALGYVAAPTILELSYLAQNQMRAVAQSGPVVYEDGPMVALTFDDGFHSVYSTALPELQDRGMTATAYITVNLMGSDSDYINTSQLQEIAEAGWEIGSHGMDHVDLTALPEPALNKQLRDSYNALSQLVGDVKSFSTPFGEFNGMVLGNIRQTYSSHVNAYGPQVGINDRVGFYAYNVSRMDTAYLTVEEICDTISTLDDELYALIFHRIDENTGGIYDISLADFDQILDCIQQANVKTVTVSEGVKELLDRSSNLAKENQ